MSPKIKKGLDTSHNPEFPFIYQKNIDRIIYKYPYLSFKFLYVQQGNIYDENLSSSLSTI